MSLHSAWTEPRVNRLIALADEGRMSRAMIAKELNKEFPDHTPLTRNAVIGKCKRLGLEAGPSRPATNERPRQYKPRLARAATNPKPAPRPIRFASAGPSPISGLTVLKRAPKAKAPDGFDYHEARQDCFENPDDRGVAFADHREGQCRWPLGDPLEFEAFRFCGEAIAEEGCSWCKYHRALSTGHDASHAGLKRATRSAAKRATSGAYA